MVPTIGKMLKKKVTKAVKKVEKEKPIRTAAKKATKAVKKSSAAKKVKKTAKKAVKKVEKEKPIRTAAKKTVKTAKKASKAGRETTRTALKKIEKVAAEDKKKKKLFR